MLKNHDYFVYKCCENIASQLLENKCSIMVLFNADHPFFWGPAAKERKRLKFRCKHAFVVFVDSMFVIFVDSMNVNREESKRSASVSRASNCGAMFL